MQLLFRQIPPSAERVLELGCAEGLFTRMLASGNKRVIVSVEISHEAMRRAKERCSDLECVHLVEADLRRLPIRGYFDAVIGAGVLYYLTGENELRDAASRILELIHPGGYLVLEHLWTSAGAQLDGSMIHDFFLSLPELKLVAFQRHLEYGISVFQKSSGTFPTRLENKTE